MRRGTRVGQAYIALTADGSGLNDDITDSMDEVDFAGLGDRHGQDYEDSLTSHLDNIEENFRDAGRRMGEAFDSDNAIGESIRHRMTNAFNSGDLDDIMREVGERTGTEFGGQFGDAFDEEMRASVFASVERNMREAARRGDVELQGMFSAVGGDDDRPGALTPGPMLNQITDQAEAEYRRRVLALEGRVQSDREAVWRLGFDRQAEFEREFTELLAEEERERLSIEQRTVSDREAVWRRGFEQQAMREEQASQVYERLMAGQEESLARSLADRAQMEDDDARRRNRQRIQYEADFSRLLNEQEENRAREQDDRDRQWSAMEQDRDNQRFKRFDAMARRMTSGITFDPRIDSDAINASLRRLRADLEAQDDIRLRLNADLPIRERERIQAELEGIRARIRVSVDEDALNRSMLRAQGIADRASGGRDGNLGDRIGKMFGAGSRNNAFNLIGKSIGNIINLTSSLSNGITKMTGIGGEGASMFAKMATGAVAAGAALAIVAAVAAILVSVMSALLALIVAMAATITSALVGALAVLSGGLLAVVAAGGLLTAAFMSMTDAQQALLSGAFQPLKAELTGIGQLMITQMIPYFDVWSTNLQKALLLAVPVAGVMGQAFGQAGAIITNAFSGPGFQNFMAALGVSLPSIVTRLSTALGAFLNGTMGLFAVLLPYVDRFAGYLADVAEKFSTWANSAAGQNAIVDFTDRALVSLQSLWDFVSTFFGWLGDILFSPEGQEAGNTIFDSLTRSFEGFRQSIADGSLEKWFSDAIDFGRELKDLFSALGDTISDLNNSGALEAAGEAISSIAGFIDAVNRNFGPLIDILGKVLPVTMEVALTPLMALADGLMKIADAVDWVMGKVQGSSSSLGNWAMVANAALRAGGPKPGDPNFIGPTNTPFIGPRASDVIPQDNSAMLDAMRDLGNKALNNTSKDDGGYKPKPKEWEYKYVNPYVKYAESIMKSGPSVAATIRNALITVNKQVAAAVRSASMAENVGALRDGLTTTMVNIRAASDQQVNSAQSALNNAAQALANSTSAAATRKALKDVEKAQDDLQAAQRNQFNIYNVARRLNAQKIVSGDRVQKLLNGMKVQNATLADYAYARNMVTRGLEKANQRLVDAIALRDQYKSGVMEAVQSFGSLMTAQAKSVDGVEQALTAKDITSNLQDRLKQIRDFQTNLRKLLALGLSNDAYKQLVDAGVEQGGAYAAALVQGGQGSVQQVNGLTAQINAAAAQLGTVASSRLYQAGVDAARGLVNGLESMSAQLDAAATRLGNSIARAIKKSLGIKSPSRVMIDTMGYVGDGIEKGLDAQHGQVAAAAGRLSNKIAVSPEVADYAASQRAKQDGFSETAGGTTEHHWNVSGFTNDPVTASREMINEMTGRLG